MDPQKTSKNHRVLALKPGASEIGYSLMGPNGYLIFGAHTLQGNAPGRREQAFLFLVTLTEGFKVAAIALEKKGKGSDAGHAVPTIEDISVWAEHAGLEVHTFDPDEVRLCIAGKATATAAELAAGVAARIPYLERYRQMGERSVEPEWTTVFQAIALALVEQDMRLNRKGPGVSFSF